MRVIANLAVLLSLSASAGAQAEVLIRWDQDRIPAAESLGIGTVVVPASKPAAVRSALAQGYRVFLEGDAAGLAAALPMDGVAGIVVRGTVAAAQLRELPKRMKSPAARVLTLDERARWPHIRSNWVTKNNEVLQVSGRTAQPWIESNAALLRIIERGARHSPTAGRAITYTWKPITLSEEDEGPALENYLVAIAEAGSFGGDVLLPLHERFQQDLLLGKPQARSNWNEIRRYIEFYSWDLARRYERIATIGVVTAEPMLWYEVLNLMARHNLPFELIAPADLPSRPPTSLRLLIVLDEPGPAELEALTAFEEGGGKVVKDLKAIPDPNAFALEMRRILPPEHRAIDIWNGITVIAVPYREPDGNDVLVTAVNYAHDAQPIQVRIAGTFATVSYESPDDAAGLLPFRHRGGHTEFVLPALRIGARVFLSR